ncbi:MAG: protein-L-isoaspartate O-methyltransferase [Candidatus Pacebacteria bacterium]|nr:protein-L-isoaspartate O-methyltransferase [Candidatus Paceibacterota bacterium]
MNELTDQLIESGILHSPKIIDAFRNIDRKDFVLDIYKTLAYEDRPLPIEHDQTISQPTTVAFMLELLAPHEGNIILDIGSGSGWQSALLANIVGPKGRVFAIEIVPELKTFGEKNIEKYNFIKSGVVTCLSLNAQNGLTEKAPFDRIIGAASAEKVPPAWKKQLKVGGKIVTPVKESIYLIEKKNENEFKEKEFPGFLFVPFVEKQKRTSPHKEDIN